MNTRRLRLPYRHVQPATSTINPSAIQTMSARAISTASSQRTHGEILGGVSRLRCWSTIARQLSASPTRPRLGPRFACSVTNAAFPIRPRSSHLPVGLASGVRLIYLCSRA